MVLVLHAINALESFAFGPLLQKGMQAEHEQYNFNNSHLCKIQAKHMPGRFQDLAI